MPSRSLSIRPGLDTVKTPALNEAGISATNLVRFREGLVEKRGGWAAFAPAPVVGVPRDMAAWAGNNGAASLGIGATGSLSVLTGGALMDITPGVAQSTLTNAFSTGVGSPIVSITDTNYNPNATDTVTIPDYVAVGGLLLIGSYPIYAITGPNSYQIKASSNATSTVTNGGQVVTFTTTAGSVTVSANLPGAIFNGPYSAIYPVKVGGITVYGPYTATSTGTGTFNIQAQAVATSTAAAQPNGGAAVISYYSNPTWGQPRKAPNIQAQDWTLCGYGSTLLAYPFGQILYAWTVQSPYPTAQQISTAPGGMAGILVYDRAQMVVAYGGVPGSSQPRNVVRWCAPGDYTTWTGSSQNLAGSFPIPSGSGIIGAAVVGTGILLWTDTDAYLMQYIGGNDVWGFSKIASGCGLIGQHAWAKLGGLVFWMGSNGFWVYDGASVQPLACPIRDDVFPKLSAANAFKVRGLSSAGLGEVGWSFPSTAGNGENDTLVIFNTVEVAWDKSALGRSAWIDQSVFGAPIGADAAGNIVQHEVSPDAAGAAMPSSFTTGWFLIDEGETLSFVDLIRPDVKFSGGVGTLNVTVLTCAYVGDAPASAGPFAITAATEFINTRCRGRYVAFTFASSDLGSFWRIGRPQVRWAPSGRR